MERKESEVALNAALQGITYKPKEFRLTKVDIMPLDENKEKAIQLAMKRAQERKALQYKR